MFRRYKSGGDEPGTKDEIVIKVDPIVPRSETPAKSSKGGAPAKSAPSAKSGKSGKSAKPTWSANSAPSAKSTKSAAAKSGKAAKSAAPARSGKSGKSPEPVKPAEPGRRGFGSRLVGLLARPEAELDWEDDFEDEEADAGTVAKSRAELEAELEREAEEFGLVASDPVSLYGPNGEEVAALLEDLADVDDETAEEIADSYELLPDAERKVAQSVIRRRHRGGKLGMELETAERAVADWFSALGLVEDAEIDLYSVVAAAATDAVDALVLVDELADEDFNTLYEPWADVMDVEEDEAEGEDGDAEEAEEVEAEELDEESDEEPEADAEEGEFGPSTVLVTELLTNLGTLDEEVIAELIDVWREQPKDGLKVAHRSLQALADESNKWREQMRLAQEEVFSWMEGGATRFNMLRGSAGEWARTREIAGPAVADAVAALVMADMLESEEAATLYAPWAKVVGEPALPVYEDEGDGDEADE